MGFVSVIWNFITVSQQNNVQVLQGSRPPEVVALGVHVDGTVRVRRSAVAVVRTGSIVGDLHRDDLVVATTRDSSRGIVVRTWRRGQRE